MSESRQSQRRSEPSGADPAARGLILVAVAVVLGAILLAAGGSVGFDSDSKGVDIGDNGGDGSEVVDTTAPTDTTATSEAPPVTVAPADVMVVAANGAGISGLAGSTTAFLATQGYTSSTATDATADATATAVYFADGFQPNATALATLFSVPPEQVQPLPAEPVANEQPPEAAVVIVLGPDAEAVVSGGATTTTTVPG
ncbi:MAG: LytR C-terminal domain-containing protein [Microthrixaceae bacterium]|nr:LytR C-terminal domain-containing protein [Microthrixaceae bacterium]